MAIDGLSGKAEERIRGAVERVEVQVAAGGAHTHAPGHLAGSGSNGHAQAVRFIEQLSATGVVVAIGHTAATTDQLRAAVDAGAKTSTHLGNGAHAVLPRHPNYIWDQLADDRLWMSIIPDGHHLPAAVVKCLVRAKGVGRTLVTCDASSLAGLPPGRYREWGTDLDVLPSGKIVVAGTPYLAGSGHFTDRCVGELARAAGVSLADAVEMASVRPRELLGLPVPAIAAGTPVADLVVFDWDGVTVPNV